LSFVSHGNDTTGVTSGAGLFTLNEHLSSSPVLVGFLLLDVLFSVWCFVDRCLSFCPLYFGHCVVWPLIVWSDLWLCCLTFDCVVWPLIVLSDLWLCCLTFDCVVWPLIVWSDLWLCCLIFDLQIPITLLVSSSCSCGIRNIFNFRFTVIYIRW
jgi:hypothetical protein